VTVDCSTRITITPLSSTPYSYEVAAAPGPHNDIQIALGNSWVTTTDPVVCPLNNFKLMKGDNSGAYGVNLVKLRGVDGTFDYDSSKLGNDYVYIEFES
jgi:hypothetical protein